ncbi:MAG: SufD family Fe-S cluster assembly protein [Patescibacteria group bacterium]|jgi:Fe-S cluster assembly scaffold protein SufB
MSTRQLKTQQKIAQPTIKKGVLVVPKNSRMELTEGAERPNQDQEYEDIVIETGGRLLHTVYKTPYKSRSVAIAANASYELRCLTVGEQQIVNNLTVELKGERAEAHIFILTATSGTSKLQERIHIIHRAPNCTSTVLHRAFASHESTVDFTGTISIAPQAKKSNAKLTSNGLLLSPHALIRTRPEFEILTSDVGCRHGATIGELDEAALFYMTSRGIDLMQAKRLLTVAFAKEILTGMPEGPAKNESTAALDYFLDHAYAV